MALLAQLALLTHILTKLTILTEHFFPKKVDTYSKTVDTQSAKSAICASAFFYLYGAIFCCFSRTN